MNYLLNGHVIVMSGPAGASPRGDFAVASAPLSFAQPCSAQFRHAQSLATREQKGRQRRIAHRLQDVQGGKPASETGALAQTMLCAAQAPPCLSGYCGGGRRFCFRNVWNAGCGRERRYADPDDVLYPYERKCDGHLPTERDV